jgi:tagaturonate reductase
VITDSQAAVFNKAWKSESISNVVTEILSNNALWDADLNQLPGFADAVTAKLTDIDSAGCKVQLEKMELINQ